MPSIRVELDLPAWTAQLAAPPADVVDPLDWFQAITELLEYGTMPDAIRPAFEQQCQVAGLDPNFQG